MSILIKGMEMPTSCAVCPFENYGDCHGGKVKAIMDIDDYVSAGKRHPRCPLVPVPPHGDLIDRDATRESIKPWSPEDERNGCTFDTVKKLMYTMLDRAPTIIPAEEKQL